MISKALQDEIMGWVLVIMTSVLLGIVGWCLILYLNKQLYGQPNTSKLQNYEYPQAEGLL